MRGGASISHDKVKMPTQKDDVFQHINRCYRAACRLQYTVLQSRAIDYAGEKPDELKDNLHEAAISLDCAIDTLREMER